MTVLGTTRWDTDPDVAAVKEEYEAFYLTPEGQQVDAATGREAFRALPEATKDRLADLSRRLHEARMAARAKQNGSN